MYVRLEFAVAAHLEPEILIIDEGAGCWGCGISEEVPGEDVQLKGVVFYDRKEGGRELQYKHVSTAQSGSK
ncbi:MAG: hypothetical protein Q7J35_16140 [Candidatus Methanoperedens sp.]|nr:hypothetical protein [Candidatus Methanoperedens sp.]